MRLRFLLVLPMLGLVAPAVAQPTYPFVERSPTFFNDISAFSSFDFYGSLAAPDGGFYILTASAPFENKRAALGRYTARGRVDTTYGGGSMDWYQTLPWTGDGNATLTGGVIQPDGKILTVGRFDPKSSRDPEVAFAARFNPDGTPDASFGTNGTVTLEGNILGIRPLMGIAALDGGRSVVHFGERIWLSATGAVDSLTTGATRARPVVLPDGRLLGLEGADVNSTFARLVRFNADGTRDATFGTDGSVELPGMQASNGGEAFQYRATSIVPDDQGRIYVYGAQNPTSRNEIATVARFTEDGVLDVTFGTDGVVAIDLFERDDRFHALAFLPGDRILLTGRMWLDNRDSEIPFVMLKTDGTLDNSVWDGGIARYKESRDRWLAATSLHVIDPDTVVVGYRTSDPTGSAFNAQTGRPALAKIVVGDGTIVATDASPTAFQLNPPAPNPVRGTVRLRATLAEAAPVRVTVLDVLGREVVRVLDDRQPAGPVELAVDTRALAPGAYLVLWRVGEHIETQRLTVVR